MRIILSIIACAFAIFGSSFCCGCNSVPWRRGSIEHGMPKLENKIDLAKKFTVDCRNKRIRREFEKALKARGFNIADEEKSADIVMRVEILEWYYNDIGFGGASGRRDEIEMAVMLREVSTKKILSRSNISVRSDFTIIGRYVNEL